MAKSVLLSKRLGTDVPTDQIYVIYGAPGSGKTSLASTFPKTKEAPMLYIDILEGGTKVIPKKDLEMTDVVSVTDYEDIEGILQDLFNGYAVDDSGTKVPVKYSTIVIDTLTNLEYIMKEYLKRSSGKNDMTLALWGKTKDNSDSIFNFLKKLHQKTGAIVVGIAHDKKVDDEENPSFNKMIPALMNSASTSLCAKSSYVWYTKVENVNESDSEGNVTTKIVFNTYIDAYPYLVTKCRKPKEFILPNVKIKDLTYGAFKKNVLDKL